MTPAEAQAILHRAAGVGAVHAHDGLTQRWRLAGDRPEYTVVLIPMRRRADGALPGYRGRTLRPMQWTGTDPWAAVIDAATWLVRNYPELR